MKLIADYFEYAEFNGGVHFLCFKRETPFSGKFAPKTQNCQFKVKFGTYTNSNMLNTVVVFTFCILDGKHPFGQIWSRKSKLLV